MKKLIASILLVLSLSGCAAQPDGTCATYAHGVCLATWYNGERVPSGEIDFRYDGLTMSGKEINGTVRVHGGKQWDIKEKHEHNSKDVGNTTK